MYSGPDQPPSNYYEQPRIQIRLNHMTPRINSALRCPELSWIRPLNERVVVHRLEWQHAFDRIAAIVYHGSDSSSRIQSRWPNCGLVFKAHRLLYHSTLVLEVKSKTIIYEGMTPIPRGIVFTTNTRPDGIFVLGFSVWRGSHAGVLGLRVQSYPIFRGWGIGFKV